MWRKKGTAAAPPAAALTPLALALALLLLSPALRLVEFLRVLVLEWVLEWVLPLLLLEVMLLLVMVINSHTSHHRMLLKMHRMARVTRMMISRSKGTVYIVLYSGIAAVGAARDSCLRTAGIGTP